MKFLLSFMLFVISSLGIKAQTISGTITNQAFKPISNAEVYWQGTNYATQSRTDGTFILDAPTLLTDMTLIIEAEGYQTDTINILEPTAHLKITLKEAKTSLKKVIVRSNKSGIIISNKAHIKTEQITQAELKKSACCDLAGCFETQLTVQPQTTNIITNSKELRILGLSGVYNQTLFNGLPLISGLSYTYGISSIPGTLVDNIFISKGANSVLQGFESISGQINVEPKNPFNTEKLLLNTYINSFGEKHFNANYTIKKSKWANLLALQVVTPANKTDKDDDNFLDLPLLNRYLLYDNWRYGNDNDNGFYASIGMKLLKEKRVGGQINFIPQEQKGSSTVYGQSIDITQQDFFAKLGYRFNATSQLNFYTSTILQDQESYFGTVHYKANQKNLYANVQYEQTYKTNSIKVGGSYRYLNINETVAFTENSLQRTYDGLYLKDEHIPGVFAENTLHFFDNKITWITGIRGDWLNNTTFNVTPRLLLKVDFNEQSSLRANIGTGWRTVNLFSENINLLASSRNIVYLEKLMPEKALNWGINFTKKFNTHNENITGHISFDFYQTRFSNQFFPDYDSIATIAFIKNYTGESISNGFQTELLLSFNKRIEYKAGYTFLDVFRKINDSKFLLPFNPKHKVINTLSYKPLHNNFHIDLNMHWFGAQRLPNTKDNPTPYQRPDFSKNYVVFNAQFTYNIKQFEIYTGCENILDFRQQKPIISWQNPYSAYFDISSVWGPTRGREFYIGARFRIQ